MSGLAFVTGCTGFIGLNIAKALLDDGWRVIGLCRANANRRFLDRFAIERRTGDITDIASVAAALPERVDAVFHVAASTSMWKRQAREQERINVEGTRNVLRVAMDRNARRFVYTSSIAAYGHHTGRLTEDTPSNAMHSRIAYFRTKHLAEAAVKSAARDGMEAVVLNPANVIGQFDLKNWARMFDMIEQGALPGAPPGAGSFCDVEAVAAAHLAAARAGARGESYILGGADATYLQVFERIARLLGKPAPAKVVPAWLLGGMGRLYELGSWITRKEPSLTPEMATILCTDLYSSSEKAARELGYAPASLDETLARFHAWRRAEAAGRRT